MLLASLLGTVNGAHASPARDAETDDVFAPVVINEIHVDPLPSQAPVEFVELYNPASAPVDLSYWTLHGGIDFTFPVGSVIPGRGFVVVAQDPAAVAAWYHVSVLGPFSGRLANEGDEIVLGDAQAQEVDRVAYGLGFPWPTVGNGLDHSLGLVNPQLDNAVPGSWRSGPLTPGRANAVLLENPPPFVHAVSHTPQAPTSRDAVTVQARVTDADGVSSVSLAVQVVAPGQYIRRSDPLYSRQWAKLPMQRTGDDVYTAQLPWEWVRHRNLIRYRIEATDGGGRSVAVPYADDPQPNFALFVYDGVPAWQAAINPWNPGLPTFTPQLYDFRRMRAAPVYHLIADPVDVQDAQFIPNSTLQEGYKGSDYLWQGTFVYNGVVYDHIGFRARGQSYRYDAGKNKWKFNFLPGHSFQAFDAYGRAAPKRWDKLNLSAGFQHTNRGLRGDAGMFEALSYRMFQLAGVPAPDSHFVHFRVIDAAKEMGPTQYDGDFWGLYLAIEEIDGRFLDARGLPDGNLYKMKDGTGELNNQGIGAPTDRSDLGGFMAAYSQGAQSTDWWRKTFDLPGYYSFRAVLEAVRHYDVDQGKNYFYFHDPDSRRWSIWPWDTDLTWADQFFGAGNEPFRDRVLSIPAFTLEYQNRLREIRDLLFLPEQIDRLVDEYAGFINTPADGLALVDADRAQWDYNPILVSRYVDEQRAAWGRYYEKPALGDFAGAVRRMKEWAAQRAQWIDATLLTDRDAPATPALRYTGPAGYPGDQLIFTSSAFSDPQGNQTFAAMQWRAAEVSWPGLPGYASGAPNRYEITASWTSAELRSFSPTQQLPNGACEVGRVCRVRVRTMDNTGRWSHWSAPVEFTVGPPRLEAPASLAVSEIMYHPASAGNVPGDDLEFVELKNLGAAPLDLSKMRFTSGIEFAFPLDSRLQPGGLTVVARNAERFSQVYGYPPQGEFDKKMSDKGETLTLVDAYGRTVTVVTYGDGDGWPASADGGGYSLVRSELAADGDPSNPATWRASTAFGGSPGSDDPVPILVNELEIDPATLTYRAIELYNPGATAADVGGWYLSTVDHQPARADRPAALQANGYQLPSASVVPAGGYLVVQPDLSDAAFKSVGVGSLRLLSATASGYWSGYSHLLTVRLPANAIALGRHITSDGVEHLAAMPAPTLGAANPAPQVGPLVISRLRPAADTGPTWLEITNAGGEPLPLYDPADLTRPWLLAGVFYVFEAGITVAPQGRVLVTGGDPSDLCAAGLAPPGWRVVGPYALSLTSGDQELLLRPVPLASAVPYGVLDTVGEFGSQPAGTGYWERTAPAAYGHDPQSWRWVPGELPTTVEAAASAAAGSPQLCSFEAFVNDQNRLELQWVTHHPELIRQYALWRGTDARRERALSLPPVIPAPGATTDALTWIDESANPSQSYVYWLEATDIYSNTVPLGMTTPRRPLHLLYAPIIAR